jgi:hypothetical protein
MVSSAGRAEPSRSTPPAVLGGAEPVYTSPLGAAYRGDGAHLLEALFGCPGCDISSVRVAL